MVAGRPPPSFCTGPMPYDCGSTEQTPKKNDGYKLPSFVNNLVSPFMSCWQPPINACGTPHRRGSRGAPVVSPQPPRKAPQPTTNIRDPHSNDVLCGRGGSSNRHVGNLNFRSVVAANKEMYVTLTKKQKMMVARKIVETIRSQDPPGRFLQKDSVSGLWFDIGLPRSLEKTSQALREKTPGAPPKQEQTLVAPASPGGSSFTAVTVETLSDPGVEPLNHTKSPPHSPTPVSPACTAASSPVPSSTSKPQVGPNDIPEISIPDHLESQFRPRRRESRSQAPRPRYDYYPHPPPPHHPYHPHAPPPPHSYPHPHYPHDPHHDFYHRPRGHPHAPPPYPYPPPIPMDPRDRGHYGRPPYVPSSPHHHAPVPHHVPSSPDRRDYHHHDPRQDPRQHQQTPSPMGTPTRPQKNVPHAIESTPPSLPQQTPQEPVPCIKANGAPGRQTTEVSPGRAQVSKKRRTGLDESLTRLSLRETKPELKSPSNVLQSRVRRGMAPIVRTSSSSSSSIQLSRSSSESRNRGDALAGLAALSSAALLKLDEVKEEK